MEDLTRNTVDAWPGTSLLEFGARWCTICQAARPLIDAALAARPVARYQRVEDGPGRPLGRSFRVKLWPTLILIRDGQELTRLVRPTSAEQLAAFLKTS